MLITVIQRNPNSISADVTLWQVDISQKDYDMLVEKYQNDGYSSCGTKEQILEELSEMI